MGMEETTMYVQVHTPDKAEVARLLNRAKGSKRTMAQFAAECQISASTLSRILNGKTAKPLSVDMIQKIYNSREVKEDEFLLEQLIRANGMRKKEDHERSLSKFSMYARRNMFISKEITMKNIVVSELFDRNVPVVNASRFALMMDSDTTASIIFPGKIGDMALTFSTEPTNMDVWAFYWFPQEPELDGERKILTKHIVRRAIEQVSNLFLVDSWQPEVIKGLKTSFVFLNSEVFEGFITALKDAKLNTEMSAILLDMDNNSVLEERWLPGSVFACDQSIFCRPKGDLVEDSGNEYDDFDFSKDDII